MPLRLLLLANGAAVSPASGTYASLSQPELA
jgi:hypothetical protein